jgi:hypothetical protein
MKSEVISILGYEIEIFNNFGTQELALLWQSIQSKTKSIPPFLSWEWISCWIKTYQPQCIWVVCYEFNKPVCTGLFTVSHVIRHKFINSKQLRLNQTGVSEEDQIWVEYNDFLCIQSHSEEAPIACLKAIDQLVEWDEIVISMIKSERTALLTKAFPRSRISMRSDRFSVELILALTSQVCRQTPVTRSGVRSDCMRKNTALFGSKPPAQRSKHSIFCGKQVNCTNSAGQTVAS